MKALLLAAGYATRLYPLTEDTPKPLLEVGDRPIVDYIVEKLEQLGMVDEVLVITNDKFYKNFSDWSDSHDSPLKIRVINDGTTQDGTRLGAIGDIKFAVDAASVEDDLLVLAGDNLFDFDLGEMVAEFDKKAENMIGVLEFEDESKLSKYGIVEVDQNNRLVDFMEKPENPPTNLVAMGIYLFPGDNLGLLDDYLESGGNPDEPGWYVTWLVENHRVYAYPFEGLWFDIGDKDSLNKADRYLQSNSL